MTSSRAVVALGSNLGDRSATILSATRALADLPGVDLVAVSSAHETVALTPTGDDPDAPAYLNAVALIDTTLDPHTLLDTLRAIEARHGRVRETRWGDRTLDMDLIDVAGITLDDERLTLPHPRAHERAFVLAPWLEVDPDAVLTGHGSVADLLAALTAEDAAPDADPAAGSARGTETP